MKDSRFQIIISAVLIAVGFIAVFILSNFLEKNRPPLPAGFEDQDLMLQGAKLKDYSLGFNGLIADWYWMQSLQYLGNKIANSKEQTINLADLRSLNPRLLYPLLDNATSLDPQYLAAYSYGAVVLPAIDPQQAIKITEKGIANNPQEWRLYQHLGYIYWRLQDYNKASEIYEKGAKLPGAPLFMQMMVAQMKTQGGSRTTARAIYEQMFAEAQDTQTKETAALYLMQIDSLNEREAIRSVLAEFKTKNNRCANNWGEILPLLKTVKLPNNRDFRIDKSNNLVDPSDSPYLLDTKNCEVKLNPATTKIPLL